MNYPQQDVNIYVTFLLHGCAYDANFADEKLFLNQWIHLLYITNM